MERGAVDALSAGRGRHQGSSCSETDAVLPLLLLISLGSGLQFRGPINRAHYLRSHAGQTRPRLWTSDAAAHSLSLQGNHRIGRASCLLSFSGPSIYIFKSDYGLHVFTWQTERERSIKWLCVICTTSDRLQCWGSPFSILSFSTCSSPSHPSLITKCYY